MNCWKYLLMIISVRQSIIKTFIMFSFNGIPTFPHPQDLPGGAGGKEPTCQCRRQEMRVWSLGWEDSLVKGMATQPSILAWRIPWTEEPGGLQSMGSQRVGHDWVSETCINTNTHTYQQGSRYKEYMNYAMDTITLCSPWIFSNLEWEWKPISLGLYMHM